MQNPKISVFEETLLSEKGLLTGLAALGWLSLANLINGSLLKHQLLVGETRWFRIVPRKEQKSQADGFHVGQAMYHVSSCQALQAMINLNPSLTSYLNLFWVTQLPAFHFYFLRKDQGWESFLPCKVYSNITVPCEKTEFFGAKAIFNYKGYYHSDYPHVALIGKDYLCPPELRELLMRDLSCLNQTCNRFPITTKSWEHWTHSPIL